MLTEESGGEQPVMESGVGGGSTLVRPPHPLTPCPDNSAEWFRARGVPLGPAPGRGHRKSFPPLRGLWSSSTVCTRGLRLVPRRVNSHRRESEGPMARGPRGWSGVVGGATGL